jgi:hypothetical protein
VKTLPRSPRWLRALTTSPSHKARETKKGLVPRGAFYRPGLELLEGRICPVQTISIGPPGAPLLSFQVSDNFEVSGSTYTYHPTPTNPLSIGAFTRSEFNAQLVMTAGTFSADTGSENAEGTFSVSSAQLKSAPHGSISQFLLNDPAQLLNFTNVTATQFLNDGFRPQAPFSVQVAFVGFTINTVTIRQDKKTEHWDLALQGTIDLYFGSSERDSSSLFHIGVFGPDYLLFDFQAGDVYFNGAEVTFNITAKPTKSLTFQIQGGIGVTKAGDSWNIIAYGSGSVQAVVNAVYGDAYDIDYALTAGTSIQSPGISFADGQLDTLNVAFVASSEKHPKLAGFGIAVTGLGMLYDRATDTYGIYGNATLDIKSFSLQVSLGTPTTPGLKIVDGQPEFGGMSITVAKLQVSSLITLDRFQIKFTETVGSNQLHSFSLTMSAVVTLAEKCTVSGNFQMTVDNQGDWQVQSIGLGVLFPGGVEIVDGVSLVAISGTLDNINSANWSISASATLAFGNAIKIKVPGSKDPPEPAYMALATGSIQVNADELVLTASVTLGAVMDATTGKVTKVLIGTATGTVTINWAQQLYELQIDGSLYFGVFNFSGVIKFHENQFWVLATATVDVPNFIPVIGGMELASAGFAFY